MCVNQKDSNNNNNNNNNNSNNNNNNNLAFNVWKLVWRREVISHTCVRHACIVKSCSVMNDLRISVLDYMILI